MANRSWDSYPTTYRTEEVEILAEWIRRGSSGSVIGFPGSGKSNLLGFVYHRPEVIHAHWERNTMPTGPVALIGLDVYNLPSDDLATFYRVIMRSFYESQASLNALCCRTPAQVETLQQQITDLYKDIIIETDPFLCESAVHTLLGSFREQSVRVVFVMDGFEKFCEQSPQLPTALSGLRHKFKRILSYLVGMCRDVDYLTNMNSDLHHLLDTHICYVGPMNEADARLLISQEMHLVPQPPNEEEQEQLLALTGRHPALLKAACHWWLNTSDEARNNNPWTDMLLIEPSIQSRLAEIWQGLSQEEQAALSEVQRLRNKPKKKVGESHRYVLKKLEAKGICQRQGVGWRIFSPLLSSYIGETDDQTHPRIWWNEKNEQFYQGQRVIEGLPPKEWKLLYFFVKNPYTRHTKTEIIMNVWTEEERKYGVNDEMLYRVIRGARKLIEPPTSSKPIYIISWRATRPLEGGYQFFPEGKE